MLESAALRIAPTCRLSGSLRSEQSVGKLADDRAHARAYIDVVASP